MNIDASLIQIVTSICFAVIIVISIIVHEVSHGLVAYKLGDPTAYEAGRLSFNPLKHIDPIGTIFLPLFLLISGLPVFGYAKPVPYNPVYFKHRKRDEVLTALAGPASNLVLALLLSGIMFVLQNYGVLQSSSHAFLVGDIYLVMGVIFGAMQINLVLMFFNLLPLPPLDGSKCISYFLNWQQMQVYYKIQQYSMPLLFLLIFIVPRVFGFDPLGVYLHTTVDMMTNLLTFWM